MAIAHYQFEAIHPFTDGNGRSGRILNILYLLHARLLRIPVLYLSRYIIQYKADYYRLLRGVTEAGEKELIELIFRQPYCKIQFVVDAGIAKRQTASEYLQQLEGVGVLTGERRGREIIYKHPALVEVLTA
jgi:Fic family protein